MTLERAILIATEAHAGQTDKSGEPYILHPLRVMMAVQSKEARVVAVLHDVLEDTNVTATDLIEHDLCGKDLEVLHLLTKVKNESYKEYLVRLNTNNRARWVKEADIMDNLMPSRLYRLGKDAVIWLTKKYITALKFIRGEILDKEL